MNEQPVPPSSPADFDAFISYRRADGYQVANWLRKTLQSYRLPAELRTVHERRLRVYVDTVYSRATQDFYEQNVRPALLKSKFLIVVLTPQTSKRPPRTTDWMAREIEDFRATPQGRNILIVLAEGALNQCLPFNLNEDFPNVEIVDLRGFNLLWLIALLRRGRLWRGALKLVAALFSLSQGEMPLLLEEERWQRRARSATSAALGLAVLLGLYEGVQSYVHYREASSLELATAADEMVRRDPSEALRIAVESGRKAKTFEAGAALRHALGQITVHAVMTDTHAHFKSADISSDGRRAVTTTYGMSHVWDIGNGKLLLRRPAPQRDGASSFSPDGRFIITGGDNSATFWDSQSGKTIAVIGHAGVKTAHFSRDGMRIITGGQDGYARVWGTHSRELLLTLRHGLWVNTARFSDDGRQIVTGGGYSRTVKVWNASDGNLLFTLQHGATDKGYDTVIDAVFSPSGTMIATIGGDEVLRVWDGHSHKLIFLVKGAGRFPKAVRFTPDGTCVVVASDNGARIWRVPSGTLLNELRGHIGGITDVAIDRGGRSIVTTGDDGTVRVWHAELEKLWISLQGHKGGIYGAAFTPDSRRVITVGADSHVRIWEANTGRPLLAWRGHRGTINAVAISPDGVRLATAGLDGVAHVWEAATGKAVSTLSGHRGAVYDLMFTADGKRIVTASADHTARFWDSTTGAIQLVMQQGAGSAPLYAATLSPDGSLIALARHDGAVLVQQVYRRWLWWQTPSSWSTYLFWRSGHQGRVTDAEFSPDGRRVVSAGDDGTAQVWYATSGRPQFTVKAHKGTVFTARFSPDGRRLATAGQDGTVGLWDALTGKLHEYLEAHAAPVHAAVFSPDCASLATVSADGTARIYLIDVATLLKRATNRLPVTKVPSPDTGVIGR